MSQPRNWFSYMQWPRPICGPDIFHRGLCLSRGGKGWSEKTYWYLIQYWSVLTQIRSSLCPPPQPQPSQRCDQRMFDSDDPEELSRVKTLDKRATRLPHLGAPVGRVLATKGPAPKPGCARWKSNPSRTLWTTYMLHRSPKTIFEMTLECSRLFSTSVKRQWRIKTWLSPKSFNQYWPLKQPDFYCKITNISYILTYYKKRIST